MDSGLWRPRTGDKISLDKSGRYNCDQLESRWMTALMMEPGLACNLDILLAEVNGAHYLHKQNFLHDCLAPRFVID